MTHHLNKLLGFCFSLAWLAMAAGYAAPVGASEDAKPDASVEAAVAAAGGVLASLVFTDHSDDSANEAESPPAETADQLKQSLGDQAWLGLEALTACKHDEAFVYARQASAVSNADQELAGLWLEALTEADRRDWFEAKAYFPKIRNQDQDIKTEKDFESALTGALTKITRIRKESGSCKL